MVLLIPLSLVGGLLQEANSATITLIPPPDKAVTSTGSSTKVGLGTPMASSSSGSKPVLSHNAPGSTLAPSGAVAYWNFDNNLLDVSGNGNHALARKGAENIESLMGRALSLDGVNDFVTVGDSYDMRLTGSFSISVWIKFATLEPDGTLARILEKGTTTGDKYWMFYDKSSKKVGFGFVSSGDQVQTLTTKTDWQTSRWYHIVGTYNPTGGSNNMKIYVNGVLNNEVTRTGKPIANNEPLIIGSKRTTTSEFWQGGIDELRIYKRAITASEVTSLYKTPFVFLKPGTNIITWKAAIDGSSTTAIQVVNVIDSSLDDLTSILIDGARFVDSVTDTTFVTSGTHFDLSVTGTASTPTDISSVGTSFYRYFELGDLDWTRPKFISGNYFQIDGDNGEHIVQFFSVDSTGNKASLKEERVVLDNSPPLTRLSLVDVSSTGELRLTATDNSGGAGLATKVTSGIYYKLDTASSFTFVKSGSVELTNVSSGVHTIYYYSVDNLGNKEVVKSTKFSTTKYTFCASGCDYSNLQTAINSLPSVGGKIIVKAGEYTISNSISLKSNTALVFNSGASILFKGDGGPLFKGSGLSNIEIKGGEITGQNSGVDAISFSNSKMIKVDGTKVTMVKGGNSNAFKCVDCTDVFVFNLNAKSATRLVAIKTSSEINDGMSSNIWVKNCILDDASIHGINVNYSLDVYIIGNKVSNTGDNAIDIGWSKNTEVRGNEIINAGMPISAAIHPDSADGALLIDNYIDTTGGTAIPVYRASNIDVIGNTIINSGKAAISIIDSSDISSHIKVKSNDIISPGGDGIYHSPSQHHVVISSNTFKTMPAGEEPILVVWSNNPTTKVYGN